MKKSYLFLSTLIVAAALSAAVVSCKKQTQETPLGVPQTLQGFNPLDIQDMNAYLTDFKQKMQSAQKGDDEALSLEDAAWHISSLANFEFANANVECDDVRFDTLYAQVNLTNGTVLLSDLAEAYQTISSSIEKFYNSLTLNNKHFRFIDVTITENGQVCISLMITFNKNSKDLGNHCWYYQDEYQAFEDCYTYFVLAAYPFYGAGTTELQRVLNVIISNAPNAYSNYYFTPSLTKYFYYRDYIDQYGSPCYMNSRLFASNTVNDDMTYKMCYLLDSYLGLGCEYCPTDEYILSWSITRQDYEPPFQGENLSKQHHQLCVKYGTKHYYNASPGSNDD